MGGPNCLQILVDQFKPLLARRLEAGDEVGQRVESLPWEVGYLPLYEREDVLERDKLHGCQAQAASPGDEQGQHQQREDDHLKRHLGRSVCDSKSLMPRYCGTVDEPNESGREVLYVKIRSGDLRG